MVLRHLNRFYSSHVKLYGELSVMRMASWNSSLIIQKSNPLLSWVSALAILLQWQFRTRSSCVKIMSILDMKSDARAYLSLPSIAAMHQAIAFVFQQAPDQKSTIRLTF